MPTVPRALRVTARSLARPQHEVAPRQESPAQNHVERRTDLRRHGFHAIARNFDLDRAVGAVAYFQRIDDAPLDRQPPAVEPLNRTSRNGFRRQFQVPRKPGGEPYRGCAAGVDQSAHLTAGYAQLSEHQRVAGNLDGKHCRTLTYTGWGRLRRVRSGGACQREGTRRQQVSS